MGDKKKELPRMRPNARRVLESILFLINEATRRGFYVTEYDIDKSVFVADVSHLNKYGRPITYDNYVAMKDGPVPSFTRNVLQPVFKPGGLYNEPWPPWDRVRSPDDGKLAYKFVNPKREANLRALSQSDTQELIQALLIVKAKGFHETKKWTHGHPAWNEAWPKNATGGSYEMDYAKLLEKPDDEDQDAIDDLVFSSKHM